MDTKQELATAEVKYSKLKTEIEDAEKAKETLFEELNGKDEAFDEEREKRTSLQHEIAISRIKVKWLQDEVNLLKDELERSASAAFLARQKQNEETQSSAGIASNGTHNQNGGTGPDESDGNVVMLQEELAVANEAIKDLKEILGKILSQNPSTLEQMQMMGSLK